MPNDSNDIPTIAPEEMRPNAIPSPKSQPRSLGNARAALEAGVGKATSLWHACLRLLAPLPCGTKTRSTISATPFIYTVKPVRFRRCSKLRPATLLLIFSAVSLVAQTVAGPVTASGTKIGVNNKLPFSNPAYIVTFTSSGISGSFVSGALLAFSSGGTAIILDGKAINDTDQLIGTLVVTSVKGSVSGTFLCGESVCTVTSATPGMLTAGISGLDVVNAINIEGDTLYLNGAPFLSYFAPANTYGKDIFVGYGAGNFTMGGSGSAGSINTAVGSMALHLLTTGAYNTALGANALYDGTTASYDVVVGTDAGQRITSGMGITAVGEGALGMATTGNDLTAVGWAAGRGITTGSNNITIVSGSNPISGITTGSGNVVLGDCSGLAASAKNTVSFCDGTGNLRMFFDTNGAPNIVNVPESAGAGGLYLCVDANGGIYRKQSCP